MKKQVCLAFLAAVSVATMFSANVTAASYTASRLARPTTSSQSAGILRDVVESRAMAYFAQFPENTHVISAKDFLAKVANGDNMFIIDLRSSEDYAKGHIKGAVNVPFGSDVAKALNQIPDNRPVFVYCYTGQTASQTTALLNVAGKPVTNVRSGFKDISADENFEALSSKVPAALPKAVYPVNKKVANAITAYFAEMEAQTDYKKFNISPKQVKQISDSRNKAFEILSVRKAADYAQGHIKGANLNIPFGKGMQEQFGKLPKDKKIIVYCYSGQTSSQTTAILRLLGYDAYSMSGGVGNAEAKTGWLGEGYELVAE
ncbi:MAG: rhodanese-like domain-containing protein [Oscillospiraceae bacterium]|nr:rhodanese-like domain-containing protein [Oscillospiraceae bacterium]